MLDPCFGVRSIPKSKYLICGGPFADKYGRKITLLISMLIYFAPTLGIAFTRSINLFLVLRVIEALGASSFYTVGVLMIAETFPQDKQGVRIFSILYSINNYLLPNIIFNR